MLWTCSDRQYLFTFDFILCPPLAILIIPLIRLSSPFLAPLPSSSSSDAARCERGQFYGLYSRALVGHLRGLLEQMLINPFELMQLFKFHPKGPMEQMLIDPS